MTGSTIVCTAFVQRDTNVSWTTDGVAFSVQITGVRSDLGQANFDLQPAWWDAATLMRDGRFVPSEQTSGYQDYVAKLSVEETRKLHEQFLPEARAAFFSPAIGKRSFSHNLAVSLIAASNAASRTSSSAFLNGTLVCSDVVLSFVRGGESAVHSRSADKAHRRRLAGSRLRLHSLRHGRGSTAGAQIITRGRPFNWPEIPGIAR